MSAARSKSTSGPLEVSLSDLKDAPNAGAAILLISANQIESIGGGGLRQHDNLLSDKVALIIYRTLAKIGELGEKRLLMVEDGEFRRLELIGTPECDAVLAEFGHQPNSRRQKLDDDEEDELDEDGDL